MSGLRTFGLEIINAFIMHFPEKTRKKQQEKQETKKQRD